MILTSENLPEILRSHYHTCELDIPNLTRRAIAFNTWDRNNAFSSIEELRKELINKNPASAYYSTARYLDPSAYAGAGNSAQTWADKDRKATDLTFDLDFDHIEGHDDLTYAQQIKEIARHTDRLIDILEKQYGITKYKIYFSGRRGFHVRVYDEDYITLNKNDRKAIMNQVMGNYLDRRSTLAFMQTNPRAGEVGFRLMQPSMNNWGGLIRIVCDRLMESINNGTITPHVFIQDHWPKKLTTKEINILNERFSKPTFRNRLIKTGDLKAFLGEKYGTKARLENIYKMLENLARKKYSVEIDTSVTAELNKIIRMPGSINTKHGYECREVEREELRDINYLFHNCAQTFGNKPTQIQISKPMTVHGERTFKLEAGVHTLPMHEAVLALCQIDQ